MKYRVALKTAQVVSNVFRPVYMPTLAFVVLFTLTFLDNLPWAFKGAVLSLVYLSTAALPTLSVYTYRKFRGWSSAQMRNRKRRSVAYLISLLWYVTGLHLMTDMHLPGYMGGVLVAGILIHLLCAVVNLWWKISMHAAAAGGLFGALLAFALLLGADPTWGLCACILLCGVVNASRMALRQHTLMQVVAGTLVGVIGGFIGIILG